MSKYFFECYHFNGYTGICYLKGGECNRCCKDWVSEEQYIESLVESDISVSVTKVRKVLEDELAHHILPSKRDDIINQIKRKSL